MPLILESILKQQDWDQRIRLVLKQQVGYLAEVPHDVDSEQDLEGWELVFTNFQGKYYSNPVTQELDEKYGDLHSAISDMEKGIFDQLDQDVNEIAEELIDVYWRTCAVECFWGISQLSKNMAVPRMSDEELVVINGWHMIVGQNCIENHSFSFHHEKGPK